MKLRLISGFLLLGGCATGVEDLAPSSGEPPPPGEMDTPSAPQDCQSQSDPDADLEALNRLALSRARTVASVRILDATAVGDRSYGTVQVNQVLRGFSFLEGDRFFVDLGPGERAHFSIPGDYLMGFDQNPFPLPSEDTELPVFWTKTAIIPLADAPRYARETRPPGIEPLVAVVSIEAQDENRTTFRVHEAVAGRWPSRVRANWSFRVYAVTFPGPSDRKWLMTAQDVSDIPDSGPPLVSMTDFREDGPNARQRIEAARADPVDRPNLEAERVFAERYRLSWSLKNTQRVLVTEVDGLSDECCTALGGRFVSHRITEVLKGRESVGANLTIGGHGYFGPEACGDERILALTGESNRNPMPDGFSCAPALDVSHRESYPRGFLQLPHTPADRADVERWLASPRPRYQLQAHLDEDECGIWSTDLTVEQALATASHPARIVVEQVDTRSDGHLVTLRTNFTLFSYDHLLEHEVQLAFKDGDPRLLEEGAEWIGFFLFSTPLDRSAPSESLDSGLLLPGALLPNLDYVRRVISNPPRSG